MATSAQTLISALIWKTGAILVLLRSIVTYIKATTMSSSFAKYLEQSLSAVRKEKEKSFFFSYVVIVGR